MDVRDSDILMSFVDHVAIPGINIDGSNLVDMIYVENAAEAHLQAADALEPGSPVCGQAYFISQGRPVNCWKWIDDILGLADLPPVRKSISFKAAWGVGAATILDVLMRPLLGQPDASMWQRQWATMLQALQAKRLPSEAALVLVFDQLDTDFQIGPDGPSRWASFWQSLFCTW